MVVFETRGRNGEMLRGPGPGGLSGSGCDGLPDGLLSNQSGVFGRSNQASELLEVILI